MKNEPLRLHNITDKELQTWQHLAKGLIYKEIAAMQFVSIDTIKKHVKNLYKKLCVRNRTEAVSMLINKGFKGFAKDDNGES